MSFFRLIIFSIFFQLFAVTARAQETNTQRGIEQNYVILQDSLNQGRYKLNYLISLPGWKFSPLNGENLSSPAYDDSQWKVITGPMNEKERLPENWNGFGWFGLKVKLDSSFSATHFLITAHNSGGLDFYINDSLVLKHGNPSPAESGEVLFCSTIDPGKVFIWEKGKTYQLAEQSTTY